MKCNFCPYYTHHSLYVNNNNEILTNKTKKKKCTKYIDKTTEPVQENLFTNNNGQQSKQTKFEKKK